ncbi:amino acid/amide ABC transporter substrate-binding protein, HAAT family (TC 3.A.1.4.-) [Marinospirillum celere]|uniref:Amino acid/amide ABC transporter substrate-binding protein, HAAT family (TC 3.A.1.4.-) n=1 Tax=Marinospirillum celere TaxID=1122252 RepID=A0A1I1H374_9GAMM|nr:ABC transporter substrate-binding protein [Marinospirillum celere]SFC18374.1 amino acid/amide ABC transporter substrate-binding protein, HAAT family (TC 3.A.1.4.-) [Marinospirillum celere]
MTFKKNFCVAAIASLLISPLSVSASYTDNEIRIGYLADMSGPYRDPIGPQGMDAIQMAIDDMGGAINGAKIVTYSADDRNSPDVGSSIVRSWIDERNVDMVTGLVASSVTLAAIRLLEEHDRLGLVNGAVSSAITNQHCGPNHFHWVYDTWAMSNGTARAITQEGYTDWFLLSADYSFGHMLEADVEQVVESNGGQVVGKVRHPFPTTDFASYMLQAQSSGAQVISLNNAGTDTTNAIQTASEFGITQAGQILAGMVLFSSDVRSLGLEAAQGLQFTKAWYYDINPEARAWAERFQERTGSMPTMVHAGLYSSTLHYLQAVKAAGTDDTQTVRKQMMETPVDDIFAQNAYIREDGRMVHDMYLVRVKSPEESADENDLFEIVRTIPAEEAFRPLSESVCKLVNN